MEPTIVDFVSDPPRLGFPDGSWCPTTRNQARIEARRILFGESLTGALDVPVGSLAAPGRRSETAGGERRDPVREEPPARKSPMWHLNLCPEEWGCPNCTDRRDARWAWANGDHDA
jgi:hypothetical protein